jgi:type I restriction enzyme M protein
MNSKFGQDWAIRNSSGMVQQGISILRMKRFKLPLLNKEFQLKIEKLVKSSQKKQEDSKSLYKQSEELLLKELDLLNFKPSKEKIAIKTFKQSFGDSGRLDSEYYQPKYDDLINKIKNNNFDKC